MIRLLLIFCMIVLYKINAQFLDTNYVKQYRHNVIINPWIGVPAYNLTVNANSDTSSLYQDYVSNTRVMAGIDLSYRNLSLSLGIRTPIYTNDKQQFGKSKTGSVSMRYSFRKWAFEGKYGGYSGFADATKIDSINQVLPFRKDLNAEILTFGAIYTFKAHKFSYGAAFNYSYRQIKSAWSPLLVIHTYGAKFNAQSSVLDSNFTKPIRKTHSFNRSRTIALGFAPGISGTAVFYKKLFVTGILAIGPDFQSNRLNKNKERIYVSKTVNAFVDFRFALGYNSTRFFSAFTLKSENLTFDMYKFSLDHSYSLFTIEMGYRFNTPKWLSKTYDEWSRY